MSPERRHGTAQRHRRLLVDDPGLILPPCLSGGRGLDTAGVDSGELVGVGAFAQLSGLTVETLRHYHQVGLLVPAEVDDRTGYRRYGLRQLPRARPNGLGSPWCPPRGQGA